MDVLKPCGFDVAGKGKQSHGVDVACFSCFEGRNPTKYNIQQSDCSLIIPNVRKLSAVGLGLERVEGSVVKIKCKDVGWRWKRGCISAIQVMFRDAVLRWFQLAIMISYSMT